MIIKNETRRRSPLTLAHSKQNWREKAILIFFTLYLEDIISRGNMAVLEYCISLFHQCVTIVILVAKNVTLCALKQPLLLPTTPPYLPVRRVHHYYCYRHQGAVASVHDDATTREPTSYPQVRVPNLGIHASSS